MKNIDFNFEEKRLKASSFKNELIQIKVAESKTKSENSN
jgi:hypothetical protein